MCEFMKNFRIFRELRSNNLEKIHYFMAKKNFVRGKHLFIQGVSVTDGIYLVIDGEFEVF